MVSNDNDRRSRWTDPVIVLTILLACATGVSAGLVGVASVYTWWVKLDDRLTDGLQYIDNRMIEHGTQIDVIKTAASLHENESEQWKRRIILVEGNDSRLFDEARKHKTDDCHGEQCKATARMQEQITSLSNQLNVLRKRVDVIVSSTPKVAQDRRQPIARDLAP